MCSNEGWEREVRAGKGVVREKVRWGRSCLTFLSTFEEVVEEEIGEVGRLSEKERNKRKMDGSDWARFCCFEEV